MNLVNLESKAHWLRRQILEIAVNAGKGHLGGAFSCVEILISLYYGSNFKLSPKYIDYENRDRLIFSKGHACLALYPILADIGFFPKKELLKYGKNGSILGGHPDHFIRGVEVSSGSLGHGLGIGSGLTLASKLSKKNYFVFVILGDGECNEGSVWEAVMFASSRKLSNLVAIVDNNQVGATNFTKSFAGEGLMSEKWRAFGWDSLTIDGHNFKEIINCLRRIKERNLKKPLVIIANTIKGKGVSFMENNPHWHHGVPKDNDLALAREELGI